MKCGEYQKVPQQINSVPVSQMHMHVTEYTGSLAVKVKCIAYLTREECIV